MARAEPGLQIRFVLIPVTFLLILPFPCDLRKLSVFPGRLNPPGLNNSHKAWWAKEITPDYHVAGRLTERQIKYASEVGFKSVLSLFKYADDEFGDFGGDYLPTTKETKQIADRCGLQFEAVLGLEEDWCSVEAIQKFAEVLPRMKKPVLLHCDRGFTIAYVLLMHMANLTRHDSTYTPKINSAKFYDITAQMGLDFTMDFTKEVVAQITGEPLVEKPPVANTDLQDWLDYWLAHPVYKNWYAGGNIAKSHIKVLEFAGFKTVINLRAKYTFEGFPSIEEVNLLNIQGETGTHISRGYKQRQQKERLEQTRIDPSKPNSYIGPDSEINYEKSNEYEFGGGVGYDFKLEEAAFKNSTLKYEHFPLIHKGPYDIFFKFHLKEIVEIGSKGPVLVHGAGLERATYISVLCAAVQHNLSFEWALQKTRELGFPHLRKRAEFAYLAYELNLKKKKEEL